jgi:outer membrane immunogenic protein
MLGDGRGLPMGKMVMAAAGCGLLAVALAPAALADGPYKTEPYRGSSYWSGLYVGGAVGYGLGTSQLTGPAAGDFDISLRGVQGIVTLGYDFQISRSWVLGLFADYAIGELDGSVGDVTSRIESQWAIGGRLGYLQSSTLWYATAGYTEAEWHVQISTKSGNETLNGYFVGLGVEQALSQNLSLKLEYRFSNYDAVPGSLSFDNDVSSIRLGVNWKLGR